MRDDRSPSGSQIIDDVTHGNHGFVAVGHSGSVLHSVDGMTWEDRVSGTTDGLNWTPHHTLSGQSVNSLTVARDDADQEWLVVVGRHAQIQRIPLTGHCPVIPTAEVFSDGIESGDTIAWN